MSAEHPVNLHRQGRNIKGVSESNHAHYNSTGQDSGMGREFV